MRAFEAGFEVDAKPVDESVVEAVLSLQIDDLEPRLTRNDYDVRSLVEQFDAKPAEIHRLLRGDLDRHAQASSRTKCARLGCRPDHGHHAPPAMYCASVSPIVRCVSANVRRTPASVSAKLRTIECSIARLAIHKCASLHRRVCRLRAGGRDPGLGDRSNSLEYPYAKPLAAVAAERLDGAAATAAARALAVIPLDVVASGASVSFLHPLAADRAEACLRDRAGAVVTKGLLLYAGWCAGRLAGTVSVRPAARENGGHPAEIAKLVVHPECRRRGLGEALLAAAMAGAREAGRTLLTLDTRPGDAAERLVRRHGFREVGRIEGYTRTADGRSEPTVLFALETTVTPRSD